MAAAGMRYLGKLQVQVQVQVRMVGVRFEGRVRGAPVAALEVNVSKY